MQFKVSIAEEASDIVLDNSVAISFQCPMGLEKNCERTGRLFPLSK